MAAVQTSVALAPSRGVPGMEYDCSYNLVVTKIATEAVPFGCLVAFTAEGTCELPDSSGEVTTAGGYGIALIDPNKSSTTGYEIGDAVRVLTKGRAWVLAEETIAFGDTVFARHGSGAGGSQKGAFRNDADTSTAATPTGCRFFQGGTTTTGAVLEII